MRATIGMIALVLLGVSFFTRDSATDSLSGVGGASFRVGVVMALWWLAYQQTQRLPRWLAVACAVTLLLVMRWPKMLLVAIPLLAVLWFLGPRTRRRGSVP